MRKTVLCASIAALAFATSALAMGGGGGGGYGGGMGMQGASFDDYATALRLIKHQEYSSAIPHLEAALRKRPKDADILNYLGYTHRMVGVSKTDEAARTKNFQDSLVFYQAALQINPMHKGVHEYLGELFLAMNNINAAHNEMNELVILCPDGCDERDTLAKALAAYVPPAAPAAPAAAPAPAASPAPTP